MADRADPSQPLHCREKGYRSVAPARAAVNNRSVSVMRAVSQWPGDGCQVCPRCGMSEAAPKAVAAARHTRGHGTQNAYRPR